MKTGLIAYEALESTLKREVQWPQSIIICGDEMLLCIETCDAIRQKAHSAGYIEREVFHMEARSDWSSLIGASQASSLFATQKLIEIRLPSGKPGKTGADALKQWALNYSAHSDPDTLLMFVFPKLDKTTQSSSWFQALSKISAVINIPNIDRVTLPKWIFSRLKKQQQSTNQDTLNWLADRVEGNLLAAHQEIMKLGLLFDSGELSPEQVQDSVLNVARYDIFKLKDALLANQAERVFRILEGLESEGEALPLVLWAITEDLRALLHLSQAKAQTQSITPLLKQWRFFGPREKLAQQALHRLSLEQLKKAMTHAHDIDKIIKGLSAKHRSDQAWHELKQLCINLLLPH